jgi:hypothetical protein
MAGRTRKLKEYISGPACKWLGLSNRIQAYGETGDVDKGIRGAFAQVAQGYFEVAFQHKTG